MLAAYDGDLLVARALIRPFTQYWGGRLLPMAGVAGVVVAPEYRGRGVGTALMTATAQRGRELDYPVSALYPATVSVYRRTGWEIAGVQPRISVTTRLLRELRGGDVVLREVGPGDAASLLAIMQDRYAAGHVNGARGSTVEELAEELDDSDVFGYAADDGFVVYGWQGKDLVVYQLVAGSAATAKALWAVVGSSSSVVDRVHAYVAPDDPVHQLLGECVVQEVTLTRWMLRLLDVEAALSGRGYPAALGIEVPLVVDDPLLERNSVAGRLCVCDGNGELVLDDAVRSDPTAVRLGPHGLAALYAGTAMSSVRAAGLAGGADESHDDALDTAFVGRPAYMLDYF